MCSSWVIDVEVEVHLLRVSVRPVRRDVVRCQLHPDLPLPSGVDHAMPCLVLEDVPAENPRPERALGTQVGRVEHDHVTHQLHDADATKCDRRRTRRIAKFGRPVSRPIIGARPPVAFTVAIVDPCASTLSSWSRCIGRCPG